MQSETRCPVIGYVEHDILGVLPVFHSMGDYDWQMRSLKDRLKNPELYRDGLGEDVEAVISKIKRWLIAHGASEYELEENKHE